MGEAGRRQEFAEKVLTAVERDPIRNDEARRYHEAIIATLNGLHQDGQQDALCVYDAMARVIAQLIRGDATGTVNGVLSYINLRCVAILKDMPVDLAARTIIVPDSDQGPVHG